MMNLALAGVLLLHVLSAWGESDARLREALLRSAPKTITPHLHMVSYDVFLRMDGEDQKKYLTEVRDFQVQQERHWKSATVAASNVSVSFFGAANAEGFVDAVSGKNGCSYAKSVVDPLSKALQRELLDGARCMMGGRLVCLVPTGGRLRCQVTDNLNYRREIKDLCPSETDIRCEGPAYVQSAQDMAGFCLKTVSPSISVSEACAGASLPLDEIVRAIRKNPEAGRDSFERLQKNSGAYCAPPKEKQWGIDVKACESFSYRLSQISKAYEGLSLAEMKNKALCNQDVYPYGFSRGEGFRLKLRSDDRGQLTLETNAQAKGWDFASCEGFGFLGVPKATGSAGSKGDAAAFDRIAPDESKAGWNKLRFEKGRTSQNVCLGRWDKKSGTFEVIKLGTQAKDALDFDGRCSVFATRYGQGVYSNEGNCTARVMLANSKTEVTASFKVTDSGPAFIVRPGPGPDGNDSGPSRILPAKRLGRYYGLERFYFYETTPLMEMQMDDKNGRCNVQLISNTIETRASNDDSLAVKKGAAGQK